MRFLNEPDFLPNDLYGFRGGQVNGPQRGSIGLGGRMKRSLILVILFAGCATQNAQKPISNLWIPPSDDVWQGYARSGFTLRGSDKNIVAQLSPGRVKTIVDTWQKVKVSSKLDADLGIAQTAQPNAFATHAKGRPVVILGLSFIDLLGDDVDAYATTMGHELAHIHFNHGAASKARNETAKGASQFLGALLNAAGVPLGGTIANLGVTAISTSYSRDQEREADSLGLDWSTGAGFDACGSARTMKALQIAGGGGGIPFLSSHPGHEERIDRASKRANRAC